MFETLAPMPADPLLGIIRAFAADPRADKIDLGVGVFRDETGRTPVMRAVKAAERRILEEQTTKSYQGMEGDRAFLARLRKLVFGEGREMAAVQTIGGSGAVRLAADMLVRAGTKRIWIGAPTWPNHLAICHAAGLEIVEYAYLLPGEQAVDMASLRAALGRAEPGDALLLHGCCHNPSGAGYAPEHWEEIASLLRERGVIPLIDIAYMGLGQGLAEDAAGTARLAATLPEALIAVSCSKNFGLYRDRIGALFATTAGAGVPALQSHLETLARVTYSMPAAHGAAIVATVLADPALEAEWRAELTTMRERINGLRAALAHHLAPFWNGAGRVAEQRGMFSTLPLSPGQVAWLSRERGIYMADSGRINVAGLREEDAARFAAAAGEAMRSAS
jgi:aromatic-amino-acid transaminase